MMVPYVADHLAAGGKLHHVTRHLLTLFRRQPGGKRWRQILSSESFKPEQDERMLLRALDAVREAHERRADAA
jgi:tRNA-dihydrouridine synthase A